MKKLFSWLILSLILSQTMMVFADDTPMEAGSGKFIVTAYYSPLPNQSYYLRGSYEADLALNGNGTNGASGKEVYIGMLAAPKKYPFGTKIHLEGLGVGVVDDRGGAIVPSGVRNNAYDRIDIWMGAGEEGLRRALQWGKRTVNGKILDDGEVSLEVSSIPLASKSSIAALKIENDSDDIFNKTISKKSSTDDIKQLEQTLFDLGFYKENIDGIWNKKIVDAIYDFQISQKLITGIRDFGAGYYGNKTRETLKIVYADYNKQQEVKKHQEQQKIAEKEAKAKVFALQKEKIKKEVLSWGDMKIGDIGQNVRKLQKTLKAIGYLDDNDTAIFGEHTQEALAKFQQDSLVIEEKGIGYFGEKTKNALVEKMALESAHS